MPELLFGMRDHDRFSELSAEAREYLLFCVDWCGKILTLRHDQEDALRAAANALTALGYYESGLSLDRRLCMLRPHDASVLYDLACSLALLNRKEEALSVLSRATDAGYSDASHMAKDTDLKNIRDDIRFVAILKKISRRDG